MVQGGPAPEEQRGSGRPGCASHLSTAAPSEPQVPCLVGGASSLPPVDGVKLVYKVPVTRVQAACGHCVWFLVLTLLLYRVGTQSMFVE